MVHLVQWLQTIVTIEMSLVQPKQTIILELDIKYKQMKVIFVNDFFLCKMNSYWLYLKG
jgi:hypothetical protein